mgnify:CR=1 FL=1
MKDEKWGRFLWATKFPDENNPPLLNMILNGGNPEMTSLMLPNDFYNGTNQHPSDTIDAREIQVVEEVFGDALDDCDTELEDPTQEIQDDMLDSMDKNWSDSLSDGIDEDRQVSICGEIMDAIKEATKAGWASTWIKFNNEDEAKFAQSHWKLTLIPNEDRTRVKFVIDKPAKKPSKESREAEWDAAMKAYNKKQEEQKKSRHMPGACDHDGDDNYYYIGYSSSPKTCLPPILASEGEAALDPASFYAKK